MIGAEAYPLSWPAMYPRTAAPDRRRARFDHRPFGDARDRLLLELERLGAIDVVLSSNLPLRRDGIPAASRRAPDDPGVAVYFRWQEQPRSLACDRWDRIENNLHAMELTIQAMRGLDRWGASDILNRAFTGLTALPAPPQWWDVLQCGEDAPLSAIEAEYKKRIILAHPDRGGSEGKAASLNWAIAEARRAKGAA